MTGGEARYRSGLADVLVNDGVQAVKQAVTQALARGVPARHRTDNYPGMLARLNKVDTAEQPESEQIQQFFAGDAL